MTRQPAGSAPQRPSAAEVVDAVRSALHEHLDGELESRSFKRAGKSTAYRRRLGEGTKQELRFDCFSHPPQFHGEVVALLGLTVVVVIPSVEARMEAAVPGLSARLHIGQTIVQPADVMVPSDRKVEFLGHRKTLVARDLADIGPLIVSARRVVNEVLVPFLDRYLSGSDLIRGYSTDPELLKDEATTARVVVESVASGRKGEAEMLLASRFGGDGARKAFAELWRAVTEAASGRSIVEN